MKRLLVSLFPLLATFVAFAQKAADDAPTEHASPLTVLVFLGLFFGSILAYVVYLWWRARGAKEAGEERG